VILGAIADGRLALYLTAGMVATVNPCGFAMLPAYLSYFLGGDDEETTQPLQPVRVALAVSAGFLTVFAIAGTLVRVLELRIYEFTPWISIVIGVALAVLGVAMLFGFELSARLPKLERGGRSRSVGSMFVFGVSYAIASIGCTLPIFLSAVAGTVERDSFAEGLVVFAVYGAGMALVLTALTVATALARTGLLQFLRASQQYVNRVAGGLVALAGAYVAYYGVLELRTYDSTGPDIPSSSIVDTVTGWSSDINAWITDIGAVRLAGIFLTVVVVACSVTGYWRQSTKIRSQNESGI
jgi:cytochrome c biogenesis protein CcdA